MTAAPQSADIAEPVPLNRHRHALQVILDNLPLYAALYTLCDLRIPDRLARSAATVDDLAEWVASTMCAPNLGRDYLQRVLRAAHACGFLRRNLDGAYQVTDFGLTLRSGIPDTARTALMRAALRAWTVHDAAAVRPLPSRDLNNPIDMILHRLDLYQALHLFCALRIPDRLDHAPAALDDVHAWCQRAGADEGSGPSPTLEDLVRLLQIADAQQWIYRTPSGTYRQTDAGHMLTQSAASGGPSMWPAVMTYALPPWRQPLATMQETVRTGTPAALNGHRTLDDLMAGQPASAARVIAAFHAWQSAAMAPSVADAIAAHADTIRTVITIGGSHILLAEILHRHPHTTGVHVGRGRDADAAADELARRADPGRWGVTRGHAQRVKIPIGFRPLYVMPCLIHNADDRDARDLLARVAAAMDASGPGSILWLVETVMPDDVDPHPSIALDLLQMTRTRGGRARTRAEYATLLRKAGLRVSGEIAAGQHTIIAAHTARDQPPTIPEQRALVGLAENATLPAY
ncbi:methyltransferase [Nonomuraea sp. NPDC049695]|uniref:methyltransferase n=1 Tax=Nonomuraea sp. NPDC049695 TaxID=3154734 RepID=UPI003443D508